MSIRIAMLSIFLWGSTWVVAQGRAAAPPPRPAPPPQTATPTATPPTATTTQPATATQPATTNVPASIIGPPTPITTQAAGPGSSQMPNPPPQAPPIRIRQPQVRIRRLASPRQHREQIRAIQQEHPLHRQIRRHPLLAYPASKRLARLERGHVLVAT